MSDERIEIERLREYGETPLAKLSPEQGETRGETPIPKILPPKPQTGETPTPKIVPPKEA